MTKRNFLGCMAVFVLWSVLDLLVHVIILSPHYQNTVALWREPDAMKPLFMYAGVLITSVAFTAIYSFLVKQRGARSGIIYGLLWGIGTGSAMGLWSYAVQPIPFSLAIIWVLGIITEGVLGGILLSLIIKEDV